MPNAINAPSSLSFSPPWFRMPARGHPHGGRDDQSQGGLVGFGGQDTVGVALDPTEKRRRSNVFDGSLAAHT